MFEEVAFEGFPAHDFAAAGGSKTLGGCFAGFQFRHGLLIFRHNRLSYHGLGFLANGLSWGPASGVGPVSVSLIRVGL